MQTKTKQNNKKKKHSTTQLDEKKLAFSRCLDHFAVLNLFNACQVARHFPCIIKDDSSEGV